MIKPLLGHGNADQAASKLGHKVDGLRRDPFRGKSQVAFVLAVFVINHHDHARGADLLQRGGHVREWRMGRHRENVSREAAFRVPIAMVLAV